MVEAAKGKSGAAPPPRLIFAWWCDKYQAMPGPGSVLEQDYREMYLNDMLPRIYSAVQQWRTRGGVNMAHGDQMIINWLVKIGAMAQKKATS